MFQKFKKCPDCSANLIDDYWDTVEETDNGNFILDVFEAWVCENRCGFYVRKGKENDRWRS